MRARRWTIGAASKEEVEPILRKSNNSPTSGTTTREDRLGVGMDDLGEIILGNLILHVND